MDALGTDSSGLHDRPKSPGPNKGPLNRKDYVIGLVFLLLVVFLWTASNFVTQVGPCLPPIKLHPNIFYTRIFSSMGTKSHFCESYSLTLPGRR